MATSADFVVVGAGSAGCAVASRLAEDGARVILLEAGRSDRTPLLSVPGMITAVQMVPRLKRRFDWGYKTVPQSHALGRQIGSTRGKVLGGSSSINGMLFVRGHRSNYDAWVEDGCVGWGYDDVLPSFKRLEDWEDGAGPFRGSGGPIAVTRQTGLTEASVAFMDTLSEFASVPKNDDYNAEQQEGVSALQQSTRGGRRYSSARGYLHDRKLPNLHVYTGKCVSRIVLNDKRATGVEVLEGSATRVVRANQEVILAAGAFGSPQILMLSGIGPAEHLRKMGISVIEDLQVGENLHDHLFVPLTFLMRSAVHRATPSYFVRGMVNEMTRRDTWFGRMLFETTSFIRTPDARGVPDLQILTLPWSYPEPNADAPVRLVKRDPRPALTVMAVLIYPKSRGHLRLASANPKAPPLIDPAYLSEPDDAHFLVNAIKYVREVMASRTIAPDVTEELIPGRRFATDEELTRELPNRIHTVYHPVGTCRMGIDDRAVVDPTLRVRGIDGLRVADASIMPSITGGNTNAPSIMIGEQCAHFIQ